MVLGIMGAMDEEIELYLTELKDHKEIKRSGFTFFSGKFEDKSCVLVKSGCGKVSSAICAQILIDIFYVNKIIFTGVAGALNQELEIKDIVVSKDCIQHDVDASALGFPKGQILFTDLRVFEADKNLRSLAIDAAKKERLTAIEGRILSGEEFITDAEKSVQLRKEFDGDCVDMESAAVAHACTINSVPFLIIRSISDKANHNATIDFPSFMKEAAKHSFLIVKRIVKKL